MQTRPERSMKSMGRGMLVGLILSCVTLFPAQSQTTGNEIYISPLFEYPIAPEALSDLQSRSDWLMDHFWDGMDFTQRESVDQNALNDALNVYGAAAVYANPGKLKSSIDKLVKNLKGNPVLTLQFAKGVEEIFYGPRAIAWVDELYIPFIKAVLDEKNISDTRKLRYRNLLETLQRNARGSKFPLTRLTLSNGRHKQMAIEAPLTLVEFGNPDCDDCKFAKMKLEMAADLMEMVENKDLNIMFVVADAVPEDEKDILEMLQAYPLKWITGISYGGDDVYDIRMTPSFYIIDKKGNIIEKNLDVSEAVNRIRNIRDREKSTEKKR